MNALLKSEQTHASLPSGCFAKTDQALRDFTKRQAHSISYYQARLLVITKQTLLVITKQQLSHIRNFSLLASKALPRLTGPLLNLY